MFLNKLNLNTKNMKIVKEVPGKNVFSLVELDTSSKTSLDFVQIILLQGRDSVISEVIIFVSTAQIPL